MIGESPKYNAQYKPLFVAEWLFNALLLSAYVKILKETLVKVSTSKLQTTNRAVFVNCISFGS